MLISVVIGMTEHDTGLEACLRALLPQAAHEIIVVTSTPQDRMAFPQVKFVQTSPDELMPRLWKRGLDEASGEIIAFTVANCIPSNDWLSRIESAFSESGTVAGVGGAIAPPDAGVWAIYFARYSAFMPTGQSAPFDADYLPGENAAYRRADLAGCADLLQTGFWETLIQARLRSQGFRLIYDPALQVQMSGEMGMSLRTRFQHGRHYGRTRPMRSPAHRLIYILTAPLVTPLLFRRIARRVPAAWRPQLIRALPPLLLLVMVWNLGELSGYLSPVSAPAQR